MGRSCTVCCLPCVCMRCVVEVCDGSRSRIRTHHTCALDGQSVPCRCGGEDVLKNINGF